MIKYFHCGPQYHAGAGLSELDVRLSHLYSGADSLRAAVLTDLTAVIQPRSLRGE